MVRPEARTVTVHCQSKDDDLGFHDLGVFHEYSWSFHPNALGGTLFWCRLYIAETDQCLVFDAYRQNQHSGNHVLRWEVEGADGVTGKTENGVPVRDVAYWHPC
ncbi:unnamed protein product [Linum tenue]|uniref:S-protein homolog n=1 Tax=Linum tenue TaxID=586396 RepID=A0AAV0IBG5_9ROSI|nr:unnamed protein product [Linum tenue]